MSSEVLERFEKELHDPQKALAHQERLNRDLNFLLSHLDEWREKYPNRWIAVYNGNLVAVEDTQERLLASLSSNKVPLPEVLIDFVSEQRVAFLLLIR